MIRPARCLLICALALAVFAAACGGDDDGGADDATPSSSATAAQTTGSPGARTPTSVATQPSGATPAPARSGRTFTMADAQALLNTLLITPPDLSSVWTIGTDTTSDNAAAAATDPNAGASFERCGRLLSRLVVNMSPDTVPRYIGGETVSYFSTATVYATSEGAADCSLEAASRFGSCPELAKAFGQVFIDPNAVSCVPVDFPQTADGSFATTLQGKISAAGNIVDLTIQIVAFRKGNVTLVVGNAAAFDPLLSELEPLVELLLERVSAAQ